MRATALAVLLVCGFAGLGAAQEPQEVPAFGGEVRVNNITVDVQVHDANGVPVGGLTRKDFRVFENGGEQPLTNFLAVTGGEIAAAADAALAGEAAGRQVLIFFDLYLMTEPDKRRVLEGLQGQLEAGLPPAMQVAIVSYDGTLRVHTPPTASREKISAALKEIGRTTATGLQRQVRLGAFDTRSSPRRETWGQYDLRRTQNAEYWDQMRRMVGRVETAFSAAIQRFSATQERKVVILVSPGFPRSENLPVYRDSDFFIDTPPDYRHAGLLGKAAYLASELEYTLYTLDPSGNQLYDNVDASVGSRSEDDVATVGFWREADRKDTLLQAARLTGGEAMFTSDAAAALADVERLTASFYSLGYQPDHFGDGKTYTIRVEVDGHPEYKLKYRSSYTDRPFEQRQAERARAALLTGETANPLGILLALDKPKTKVRLGAQSMRSHQVDAELRIPYQNLVMVPRGPVAWGQVMVVVVVVDKQGNQSDLTHRRLPIQIDADKLADARRRGYYSFKFSLQMEGGEQSLRIAVEDLLAHSTSTVLADLKL